MRQRRRPWFRLGNVSRKGPMMALASQVRQPLAGRGRGRAGARHKKFRPRLSIVATIIALAAGLTVTLAAPAAAAPATAAGAPIVASTLTAAAATKNCRPYPDVTSDNVHCKTISWLKDQKITKPADGKYHANDVVTRGSMTAFLFRLHNPGKPAPTCSTKPFKDVEKSDTFCGYITWAANKGIAKGLTDGTYRPGEAVTRGAMAAFLYRIAGPGGAAKKCTTQPFDDVPTSHTFCGVVQWLSDARITAGIGDGTRFGVSAPVTRGSMATFLYRIDQLEAPPRKPGKKGADDTATIDDDGADDADDTADETAEESGIPAHLEAGSAAYMAAIAGVSSFRTKLEIAIEHLTDGGEYLGKVYYGPLSAGVVGQVSFPSCDMTISHSTPDDIILDVLRHEYIHVLQCLRYGLNVDYVYGGDAFVERGADVGAFIIGARDHLYYLQYDPHGLGLSVWDFEWSMAFGLLDRYNVPYAEIERDTRTGISAAADVAPLTPRAADSGVIISAPHSAGQPGHIIYDGTPEHAAMLADATLLRH